MVLGPDAEDMKEAVLVSEGMEMSSKTIKSSVILREDLMEELMSTDEKSLSDSCRGLAGECR